MSVKESLKRGALITAANWHVVLIQFVADALFKVLLALPIVGGVFLVVLLIGAEPGHLLSLGVAEIVPALAGALLAQPLALVAFVTALLLVVIGGSVLMFLVKGGTVAVLVAAERTAGAIERPPLRLAAFQQAACFSLERFTGGAAALFRRYLKLGVALMVVYALATTASVAVVWATGPGDDWRLLAAGASALLVVAITIINAVYLLVQMVIAVEDCGVRRATRGVLLLLRRRFSTVCLVFGATLGLVLLSTAASILAATALGLIAFVPLLGLAAVPLQLIAWLVRGVVFQYVGLAALSAYASVYRGVLETAPALVEAPFALDAARPRSLHR